ncbi:MAG: hypothetical protein NTY53_25540, partial [Kiritimatiellaeota bacterium]|nr:hypothetical protein [Kiritimatiellota bacterium]
KGLEALSDRAGLPIRRRAAAAAAPGLFPAAAALAALGATFPVGNIDAVAAAGSADLAQAFRGPRAALAQIIRESTSAADCEAKIKAFTAHLDVGRQAQILEQAMAAYAANGISAMKISSPSRV